MTEGLQGNTVTCDNFFTSYALAEELLKEDSVSRYNSHEQARASPTAAADKAKSTPVLPLCFQKDAHSGVLCTQMWGEYATP